MNEKAVFEAKLENIFSQLTEISDYAATTKRFVSLQAKYLRMQSIEAIFEKLHNEILVYNTTAEPKLKVNPNQSAFNNLIDVIRTAFLELKQKEHVASLPNSCNSSQTSMSYLKPLDIKPFSGLIEDWIPFVTLYNTLVHQNDSVPVPQKYLYLRSCLKGEALSIISDLSLDPALYEQAFQKLESRYDSPRRITSYYLNKILNFKSTGSNIASNFVNVHYNAVSTLRTAAKVKDLSDFLLFSLCYRNLDFKTQSSFDMRIGSAIPTCDQLFEFLTLQSKTSELHDDLKPEKTNKGNSSVPFKYNNNKALLVKTSNNVAPIQKAVSCPVCKADHRIYDCSSFRDLSVSERYATIKQLFRCFKCLGNHIRGCKSHGRCQTCKSNYHHSMLHNSTPVVIPQTSTTAAVEVREEPPTCNVSYTSHTQMVLLGTIEARIVDANGTLQPVRCVIDSGSQINAISESCVQRLGLKRRHDFRQVAGLSNALINSKGLVNCTLRSKFSDDCLNFEASIFPKITGNIPNSTLPLSLYDKFKSLQLADKNFYRSLPVDILLGSAICSEILFLENSHIISGKPLAIRTSFGYILMGEVPHLHTDAMTPMSLFIVSEQLDKQIRNFWELEEIVESSEASPEDVYCESHFVETHSRNESGRYIVSLPFKPNMKPLAGNRHIAYKSYLNLEARLNRNPEMQLVYNDFLNEYLALGHMTISRDSSEYILPHHAVHKSTSSSTKLRVVFNGSASDSTGISLNDRLYPGPKLQKDLPEIISSFRFHQIAICADIKMMYRQILVDPADCKVQHIFWRHLNENVQEFELLTLTYGLTPSAFIAQRVLKQLVLDEGNSLPLASEALMHHTYMDDVITGAGTPAEAEQLESELIKLLGAGQFRLRKWSSNLPNILKGFSDSDLETPLTFTDSVIGIKILGLVWNPSLDIFSYFVVPYEGPCNKRQVLSYMARIFDPMGWVSPVIFSIKCFLQSLWLQHITWDSQPDPSWCNKWSRFCEQLPSLSQLHIPRKISLINGTYRLLGFCDASERGYAACVYLHAVSDDSSTCNLLQAKSKVAPLKTLTIPRLELSGALLLAKLLHHITSHNFVYPLQEIKLFCDSQIVLTWLKTPPHMLKNFVANRVNIILKHTSISQWSYIASEYNPADIASRGLNPSNLIGNRLWWHGPPESCYSPHFQCISIPPPLLGEVPELKKSETLLIAAIDDDFADFINRFSSLTSLQNTVAYINRFCYNSRNPTLKRLGPLSSNEISQALLTCVALTQRRKFSSEIQQIKATKLLPRGLQKLMPFLDSRGLLRVGGRLQHSSLNYDGKHPLLLPKDSALSKLLCDYYHVISLHSGASTTQALISCKFWIVGLRSLVRQRIHRCLPCYRLSAKPSQPLMANLPAARVNISRAFSHAGLDFAGPFLIKTSLRRNAPIHKAYLCVFVCMSTKAVHLELVSELSTEAFMACFTRFASRRGSPSTIYSDCGRNFVGASRSLKEATQFLTENRELIFSALASRQVNWMFNPPYAPNFGGLWESCVKSAKALLVRTVGTQSLTFEELATVFARIEAVLNSRPLSIISSDPNDGTDYLSPGHFLIGGPILNFPEKSLPEEISLRSRWQRLRQMTQSFWRRWSNQYLNTLSQRSKWNKESPNFKIGDFVFVTGMNTSPLSWPIGRITELFPGTDGTVRVVSVKTSSGSLIRPVNKLIPFPLE